MNIIFKKLEPNEISMCAETLISAFREDPWNEEWTFEQAHVRLEELMSAKVSRGFIVLDMDTKIISTIVSHGPAYLDKEKERIVNELAEKRAKRHRGYGRFRHRSSAGGVSRRAVVQQQKRQFLRLRRYVREFLSRDGGPSALRGPNGTTLRSLAGYAGQLPGRSALYARLAEK